MNEIGRRFKIEKNSFVSSIIERVKQQMRKDAGFKKRIDALCSTVIKSQRQMTLYRRYGIETAGVNLETLGRDEETA